MWKQDALLRRLHIEDCAYKPPTRDCDGYRIMDRNEAQAPALPSQATNIHIYYSDERRECLDGLSFFHTYQSFSVSAC